MGSRYEDTDRDTPFEAQARPTKLKGQSAIQIAQIIRAQTGEFLRDAEITSTANRVAAVIDDLGESPNETSLRNAVPQQFNPGFPTTKIQPIVDDLVRRFTKP